MRDSGRAKSALPGLSLRRFSIGLELQSKIKTNSKVFSVICQNAQQNNNICLFWSYQAAHNSPYGSHLQSLAPGRGDIPAEAEAA
jgi:hypothetical protein